MVSFMHSFGLRIPAPLASSAPVEPSGFQQSVIFENPDFLIGPAGDVRNDLPH
jgi:hypothetical protein